jgi:crotonobetainyl-CoA:carnitine CoA-transferase CaiB-like acyl-CoA transferase
MFENMASFVLTEHMNQRTYGPGREMGDPRIMDPSGRPVRTADGWICVSPNTDAQAFGFFEAIGRPDLKHDPRFCSVAARLRNVSAYFQVRAEGLATRKTAEWLEILRVRQAPAMQVNAMEDLFDDPHLVDVGLIETQKHHSEGEVLALRPATRFSSGAPDLRDAPRQGEDGADVLRDFGFTAAEIADLMSGAVRPAENLP